jgi:NAD(P)-dependent dehydrogenase (short-subunit alcohol dehydrogenase family)
VRRLAGPGATVVFTYRENGAAAGEVVAETGATAVRADQADLGSLDAMFEPVADGLDILVNNAANTVSPGATDTDLLRETNPPEALPRAAAMTALQRPGRPDDIAAVVAFLAGPDSGWITGQNIRATGGLLI